MYHPKLQTHMEVHVSKVRILSSITENTDIFTTLNKLDFYSKIVLVLTPTMYCRNYLLLYTLLSLVGHMTDILSTDLTDMLIQKTQHHLTNTNVLEPVTE